VGNVRKKILVVDDERDIVDLIRYNLTKEGYDVSFAYDGKAALEKVSRSLDLVILDVMMPVMDGFETCRQLKRDPQTNSIPVVFLTAKSSEVDEVVGLELGADDFIQKPISPRKFIARVKTILRRAEYKPEEEASRTIIRADRLEINRSNFTVHIGKKEVVFPKKEFEILALLASNRGKVFSREMLLNAIWGNDVVVIDRTIDVHIRRIREKLGDMASSIETIKGVGYRYSE
jgi:two-component system alkaline phosphatase synthesis response regulator PhoP